MVVSCALSCWLVVFRSREGDRGQLSACQVADTQKGKKSSGYPVGGEVQDPGQGRPGQGRAGHLTRDFPGLLLLSVSLSFEA